MPIKHAIWKVGHQPVQLASAQLPSEQMLEDMIVSDPRILSNSWTHKKDLISQGKGAITSGQSKVFGD